MKIISISILFSFCCLVMLGDCSLTSEACKHAVKEALSKWQSRATTREELLRLDCDIVENLGDIAKNTSELLPIRLRALNLLATFQGDRVFKEFCALADNETPIIRCLTMQALVELAPQKSVVILIQKLDDHAPCVRIGSSHNRINAEVFVSDEAVRLLENVTGLSFEEERFPGDHRNTKPWKEWWKKQKEYN